jgi:hypothetical protein
MMAIPGALGASVIDYPSGSMIGTAGRGPGRHDEADGGDAAHLISATMRTAAFASAGKPQRVEDIVITAGNGYHLLHPLAHGSDGRLVLYMWLDRAVGNLAVTQRRLNSIAAQF